jgi:hypothetical protein
MRRMLLAAAFLVFGVGIPLTALTEYSDVFFAWTVQPPLTAAFMGACYWAAGVLELLAARERLWSNARVAVPGVWLFTALTCIPTLANFGHFNLRSPAAYAWIGVYLAVPPILGSIWWRQARAPGSGAERQCPMGGAARACFALIAIGLVGQGLLMMISPSLTASFWPWDLNPSESDYAHLARMEPYMGIWLIGFGAVAACAAREGDWRRIRCVLWAGVVLPILQGMALARYPSTVRWATPAAWVYLAALAVLGCLSLAGLRRLAREHSLR